MTTMNIHKSQPKIIYNFYVLTASVVYLCSLEFIVAIADPLLNPYWPLGLPLLDEPLLILYHRLNTIYTSVRPIYVYAYIIILRNLTNGMKINKLSFILLNLISQIGYLILTTTKKEHKELSLHQFTGFCYVICGF